VCVRALVLGRCGKLLEQTFLVSPTWVPSSESDSELPAPVFIATLCPQILSRPFPLADERTELESSADVEVRGTTALLDEPALEVEADDVRRKSGKGATALKGSGCRRALILSAAGGGNLRAAPDGVWAGSDRLSEEIKTISGDELGAFVVGMASLADDEALTADEGPLLTTLIDDDKTVDEGALTAVGRPGRGGVTSKKD